MTNSDETKTLDLLHGSHVLARKKLKQKSWFLIQEIN